MKTIEKFKLGRKLLKAQYGTSVVTTLKTGKYITKLSGGGSKYGQWDKGQAEERTKAVEELTSKAISSVQKVTKPLEQSTQKAVKKNNKVAALQLQLWNSGAFNGVIDKRTGKQVTYERAVDGINGPMTRQAMENSKKKREFIPLSPRKKSQESNQKTGGLATMREMTYAARTGGMNSVPQLDKRSENFERLVGNIIRNPVGGTIDGILYTADRLGVSSNATNMLRDYNVSIPYRIASASRAGIETLYNGNDYNSNYENALANPTILQRLGTIHPLINRNHNFNSKQLQIIKDMAGKKGYITNADIKRVSEDGRYGAFEGSIGSYFSPTKVVQTAMGRSSGHNGILEDYFDVNTQSEEAQKDNQKYVDKSKEKRGYNYGTLRATMPYINSIDIMPDEYKIKTVIDLNK